MNMMVYREAHKVNIRWEAKNILLTVIPKIISVNKGSTRIGFKLSRCLDVNECLEGNGGCAQMCKNEPTGYKCECFEGFSLAADGRTCICKFSPVNFDTFLGLYCPHVG